MSSSKRRAVGLRMTTQTDKISDLPVDVVDKILSLLTLREAVRTSVLSSNWRYNWRNLTSLVFDESVRLSSQGPKQLEHEMVMIVDHVLLLHNGPIHKFKLSHLNLRGGRYFDRWILYLSRASVKEFILEVPDGVPYRPPSSLYLCDKLVHLELGNCLLKPPAAFNGFKLLTSLALVNMTMDKHVLENMIYGCPLLERLTLRHYDRLGSLKIHAPKLTFVDIEAYLDDLEFENTFDLSTVLLILQDDIGYDHVSTCGTTTKLFNFFASLPNIQRLRMVDRFLLNQSAVDIVPRRLPAPCMKLNYMTLHVNFNDMYGFLAALCILRSSPNLLELNMLACSYRRPVAASKNFMEEDYDCFFEQLRVVNVVSILGRPSELSFLKLLLVSSPALERMTVVPAPRHEGSEMLKELPRFERASANAQIICLGS